jgi:hypothetical protein
MAKYLRSMGHQTWVKGLVGFGRESVIKYKPDAVVLPENRCEYTRDFVENLAGMGILTIVRRTEPGFSKADTRSEVHKDFCVGKWFYYVDLELVWSEEFADILRDKYYKKNVVACGGFAFDPYYPKPVNDICAHYTGPWSEDNKCQVGINYYNAIKGHEYGKDDWLNYLPCVKSRKSKYKCKQFKKQKKKTALFASIWDYADRNPTYCVPEIPYGHPIHAENFYKCREGRDIWIAELKRCMKAYPDWNILLKIHPAEHPTEYVQVFGDSLKIFLHEKASEMLPCADVLIHAGSTMSIEAHLLGIPSYQLGALEDTLIGEVSPRIEKVELDKIELGKSNANLETIKKLEDTFFGKIDGQSCLRAAREINKLKPNKTNIPKRWPQTDRNYETPGVTQYPPWDKITDGVQCVGCHNLLHMEPHLSLIKCPYCSLALMR